jgi:hypothetical protein
MTAEHRTLLLQELPHLSGFTDEVWLSNLDVVFDNVTNTMETVLDRRTCHARKGQFTYLIRPDVWRYIDEVVLLLPYREYISKTITRCGIRVCSACGALRQREPARVCYICHSRIEEGCS